MVYQHGGAHAYLARLFLIPFLLLVVTASSKSDHRPAGDTVVEVEVRAGTREVQVDESGQVQYGGKDETQTVA